MVVSRAYIQSTSYGEEFDGDRGKRNLPKVGNYFTVGAPMRGASKAWNPLNNNFKPPRQNLWVDFVDKLRKLPSTHG